MNNMKLYSESKEYKLYHGSMLDMLEEIEPNSVDAIITDPPYELNFMNKGWDNSGIAFNKEAWEKCFKVLKPGGHLLAFGGSRTFWKIAAAINEAGFEIRDTIMWLYGCYSKDTQVLTNEGWKYFYELNKNEKIMQFDKDKNELSWVKPLNYFEYDIDDEMVLLENRHTSQLITKNHKVVCDIKKKRKQYKGKYDYIEAQNILKSDCVKLPLASYYYGKVNCEYAYMVGWWLTDAWIHNDKKACMFSQSKPYTLEKLRNELQRLKDLGLCNFSEYTKKNENPNHNAEHTFYVTGKLAEYLLNNYYNREIDYNVIEFNKESKEKLLEGLMDGDGSYRKEQYSRTFWSMKEKRNNVISALLTTMGYRNYIINENNHVGVVFNIKHDSTELQFKHKKDNVLYHGKVYCLQTETGAFVVRRNGKPFISGNSGFPKSMNIGLAIDKRNGVDNRTGNIRTDGKATLGDIYEWANGRPDTKEYEERKAQNEWEGWGTCLKPAYEPILVCRKPVEDSIVDNVIKYGVGGLNIGECKVGNDIHKVNINDFSNQHGNKFGNGEPIEKLGEKEILGRFPSNVILTYDETDYEEVCGGMPYTKGNGSEPNYEKSNSENRVYMEGKNTTWHKSGAHFDDEGSAARYFYCAKATKFDRDEGLDSFEEQKSIRINAPREKEEDKFSPKKNTHATVKPVSLMRYLVRLVSHKGATILDCFNGSGSTGKAVMLENKEFKKDYKYIGIELTDEYLPISKARIEYIINNEFDFEKNEETKISDYKPKNKALLDIFDFGVEDNE